MVRLVIFLGILIFFKSTGQERCRVPDSDDNSFEEWIEIRKHKSGQGRWQANPYNVRVVVHVIHKGEPVGVGTNISDLQIKSQLSVLNNDFKRGNADAINTPGEFLPLTGSMNIAFDLYAITRTKGTKSSWTLSDEVEIKSSSYWPAEDYLNIWVCDITDYFGYTQFPISTLPGIDSSPKDRLTDGILISYQVFGSRDFGSFSLHPSLNKGRTLVHEMGHFLGLRHIWGDEGGCVGTDFVSDTPIQSGRTTGCPSHPQIDCSSVKMFQNFMDLSDDACMNLFTKGQVERMTIVLENSPRRSSLLLPLDKLPISGIGKVFSPNGDGINDYWIWDNPNIYNTCTLYVFNRFGRKVYEKQAYDNTWDGNSSDGILLEPEAYYYVIRCPNQKEITGGVRIVR